MFPFDPLDGTTLTVLTPLIILLYVIILFKLRHKEEQKTQSHVPSLQTKLNPSEIRKVPSPPAKNGKMLIAYKQQGPVAQFQKSFEQAPTESLRDIPIKEEDTSKLDNDKQKKKRKSFFLFGEQDFEGCLHDFGHLSTVAKNTPIPEECFGCPEILECMKCKTK